MNQSQLFLAITCNSPEAQEKSCLHGTIGFGFASHWLKNWRESFKPITKLSNRNHVITFDSHLKTALLINKFQLGKVTRSVIIKSTAGELHKQQSHLNAAQVVFEQDVNLDHHIQVEH